MGDELAGRFNTHSFGFGLNGGRNGLIMNLAYTQIGTGGLLRSPWGGTPLYNSMMLQNFNRAGERALRLGLSLKGSSGWSGFMNIASGRKAINANSGEQLPNVIESDFTLDYKAGTGTPAEGLWIRLRAGYADFEDGGDRWNARVILNYPLGH